MNEWTVTGVLVTLVGLFLALYTPLAKRNREQAEERVQLEKKFALERGESDKRLRELQEQQNRALIENTAATTRLNTTLASLSEKFDEFKNSNADSHRRLWGKCGELDSCLGEHETRITVLERERGAS